MVVGYVLIGAVLGGVAAAYALVAWNASLWLTLLVYALAGNAGLALAVCVSLGIAAMRAAPPRRAESPAMGRAES